MKPESPVYLVLDGGPVDEVARAVFEARKRVAVIARELDAKGEYRLGKIRIWVDDEGFLWTGGPGGTVSWGSATSSKVKRAIRKVFK